MINVKDLGVVADGSDCVSVASNVVKSSQELRVENFERESIKNG